MANQRLVAILLWASLALTCLLAGGSPLDTSNIKASSSSSPANANSSGPHWRRPGCFKVGHMRLIQIPGCIMFNLTTNACRGFCLSYSLPAPEGGLNGSLETIGGFNQEPAAPSVISRRWAPATPNVRLLDMKSGQLAGQQEEPDAPAVWINRGAPTAPEGGKTVAALAGPQQIQGSGDVVSVSQCCSMAETEDVIVSLRCVGTKEERNYVFKSALSCECFFCKRT